MVYVQCKLCNTPIKLQPKLTQKREFSIEYQTGQNMLHLAILKGLKQTPDKQSSH